MSDASDPKPRDYRDTVFLPRTDFPMKAGLPQKEPAIQARWAEIGLYEKLRAAREGREKFILHDGPPYANGDIHVGHALNHVLKDTVVRTQSLLGKDAPYVPGWDCHGLPIEWKVEELYRKKKRSKKDVPPAEFRAECRDYAAKWVEVQKGQLQRLGVQGRWDKPYLTMRPEAEGAIVAELHKFAETGQLYRGSKPVMWSPVEETALADAEVEYQDLTDSPQIDVAFEIVSSPIEELVGAHAVIWTTTPWTIPVNQALAYGPDVEYVLVEASRVELIPTTQRGEPSILRDNSLDRSILIAKPLLTQAGQRLLRPASNGYALKRVIWEGKGSDLVGTFVRHPIATTLRRSRESGNPAQHANTSDTLDPRVRGEDGVIRDDGGKVDVAATIAAQAKRPFYDRLRPMLPGDFVTTDSGTGIVHMSPDHGEDDFNLCKAYGIEPVFAVQADGRYRDDWPWLGVNDVDADGKERRRSVINKPFNAPDGPICRDLSDAGALLSASADYRHSYPHSWRSKAKVIYRCTPQWFIAIDELLPELPNSVHPEPVEGSPSTVSKGVKGSAMLRQAQHERVEGATLRTTALSEIAATRFVPEKGRNRLRSMVEGRPDWLISRQRAWGVPLALFVHRKSGELLVDPAINARIQAAISADTVDAWDESRAAEFLGPDRDHHDYEMVHDILDVWFDSGSTHAFVLESDEWPELASPADLYLEGSDQHRGWFQSSLLESCGTRGRAPYKAVLTHGFTMDAKGFKMSKSLGNTVNPLTLMDQYGADIIRLWALSVDYTEDHRIGDEILKGVGDTYRKLRNTFRYLLGALDGYVGEMGDETPIPELEIYILSQLAELDAKLRRAAENYDFNAYVRLLVEFCSEDLSAFLFDIRKDSLYCDAADDPGRRAYRTVLDILFHALVRYTAPVLIHTAEEVWLARYPEDGEQGGSVHLLEWPDIPQVSADGARWAGLRALREDVMEAIEPLRREKTIRSGLEADVTVPAARVPDGFTDDNLADLFIAASVERGQGGDVTVTRTSHDKCGRCWRLLPDVWGDGALCDRCEDVVAKLDAAA